MVQLSVIIPCRNESKYIANCIESIVNQDYPKLDMEVYLVDGMSTDGTRDIIADYCAKYDYIHLIDNPMHYVPYALNLGIKKAP